MQRCSTSTALRKNKLERKHPSFKSCSFNTFSDELKFLNSLPLKVKKATSSDRLVAQGEVADINDVKRVLKSRVQIGFKKKQ